MDVRTTSFDMDQPSKLIFSIASSSALLAAPRQMRRNSGGAGGAGAGARSSTFSVPCSTSPPPVPASILFSYILFIITRLVHLISLRGFFSTCSYPPPLTFHLIFYPTQRQLHNQFNPPPYVYHYIILFICLSIYLSTYLFISIKMISFGSSSLLLTITNVIWVYYSRRRLQSA